MEPPEQGGCLSRSVPPPRGEDRDAIAPAFEKGYADLSRALDAQPGDKDARRMRIRCLAGISGQFSQAGREKEEFKYALYVAVGSSEKALQAFRRHRSVVPRDDPELDQLMENLEEAVQKAALTKDLDLANDLCLRGEYLQAEKVFEAAFRKLYGYMKLLDVAEVRKILDQHGGKIGISHYNLACVYAQASAGKAGKQERPAPSAETKRAYVDLAFEELAQAVARYWGKEVNSKGEVVPSARVREQTEKDSDLAPLHGDRRWPAFVASMSQPVEHK